MESGLVVSAFVGGFKDSKSLADRAVAQLPDERLYVAPDSNTNSIQVIMQHVAGNLRSRWTDFLTTDGEKPWRDRDREFEPRRIARAEILADWESGWSVLFATLASLRDDDMARPVTIRGHAMTVAAACSRSLSHCSYHAGQIVLVARVQAGADWKTLTVPPGGSERYNRETWGPASKPGA